MDIIHTLTTMLASGVSEGGTDIAVFALRGAVGAFFAISGYHKLFNGQRHASLVATLKADNVPFLAVNEWFVPSVEFFGGLALLIGFLVPVAALGLIGICIVATCVDGFKRITGYLDLADYVDDVLYLPEVLLFFILATFVMGGAGAFAIDNILFG